MERRHATASFAAGPKRMRHAELDESAEIRRLQETSRQPAAGAQPAAGQPVAGQLVAGQQLAAGGNGNENVNFPLAFATDAVPIVTKAKMSIQQANPKEQKTVQQQHTTTLSKLYTAHTASARQYYNHLEQLAKQQIEAAKQKLIAVQSQRQTVLIAIETAHKELQLDLDMAASDDQSVYAGLSSSFAAYSALAVAPHSLAASPNFASGSRIEVKQEAEAENIRENGAVQVDEREAEVSDEHGGAIDEHDGAIDLTGDDD